MISRWGMSWASKEIQIVRCTGHLTYDLWDNLRTCVAHTVMGSGAAVAGDGGDYSSENFAVIERLLDQPETPG